MSRLRNIILTGFSGTGKSMVAGEVARILGWAAVDTDADIVRREGKEIAEIFEAEGEAEFRRLEREALRMACSGEGRVIATGGGVLMDAENRRLLFARGLVVGLEARPETIHQRLSQAGQGRPPEERPMLSGEDTLERIRSLKAERQPFYSLANWVVPTDELSESQVAAEVVRAWQMLGGRMGTGGDGDPELAAVVTHSRGSCPIRVGWGLLPRIGEQFRKAGIVGPVYIITDDNVFPLYGRQVQRSLQREEIEAHCFIIPAGEESKSWETADAIYHWLASRRAERRHTILAVGGGVVGDLAGFVAATYLRGMPFVQAPTSMAAMVDASIGGKTAVNLQEAKNLVGAFYQPQMVLADPHTLTTLGRRELSEGWAEAIKHGFIMDADLVSVFEGHAEELMGLEPELSTEVIRRSMAIKAEVVSEDERETLGKRVLLNYGHTIGHAIEATTGYGEWMHGEGVSVGMMGAAELSRRMGMIDGDVIERQAELLRRFNLPLRAEGLDVDRIFSAMALDKKSTGGAIRWVLLEGVGKATTSRDVPLGDVREVVEGLLGGEAGRLS